MKPATITTILLVTVFAIAAPLLLLFTAGYRWNPRTNRLEPTGILVVDSIPRGATIRIGEEQVSVVTPARLTGFLPREYTVTVSLADHKSWRQTVTVEGGKTVFANRIRLFPDRLPERTFDRPVTAAALSPGGEAIAVAASGDGLTEIWRIDTATGDATLLARMAVTDIVRLSWAPSGSSLLAVEPTTDGVRAHLISGGDTRLLALPRGTLTDIGWSEDDPSQLVAIGRTTGYRPQTTDLTVWLLSATGGAATALAEPATRTTGTVLTGLPLLAGGIATMTRAGATSTAVSTVRTDGTQRVTLFDALAGVFAPRSAPDPYLLLADEGRGRMLLADASSRTTLAAVDAAHGEWTRSSPAALIAWDDLELHLVEPGKDAVTLTRTAEEIRAARWMDDETYALVLTATTLRAIERDEHFGDRTQTDLASFAEASDLLLTEDSAWVAGTVGNQAGLWRLRLK